MIRLSAIAAGVLCLTGCAALPSNDKYVHTHDCYVEHHAKPYIRVEHGHEVRNGGFTVWACKGVDLDIYVDDK